MQHESGHVSGGHMSGHVSGLRKTVISANLVLYFNCGWKADIGNIDFGNFE